MEQKAINMFKFAGRIERMQYTKSTEELAVVLGIYRPNSRDNNTLIRDYPRIIIKGEMANQLRNELQLREYKTFTGYLNMEEDMSPVGKNMYNRTSIIKPYAQMVTDSAGKDYEDIVVVGGIVRHVYRRAEPDKRFYLMTLEVKNERKDRVGVIFFDPEMAFEPKVGDYVLATATYRVRTEKIDNTYFYRNQTSVVASRVSILRNTPLQKKTRLDATEDKEAEKNIEDAKADADVFEGHEPEDDDLKFV